MDERSPGCRAIAVSRAVAGGPGGALGAADAGGNDASGDAAPDGASDAGGLKRAPNDAGAETGVNVGVELLVHPVSTSEEDTAITAHAERLDNLDIPTD